MIRNSTTSSDINNSLCEVVGCYSKADTNIAVHVGSQGTITLLLCNNCVPKFDTDGKNHSKERK